MFQDDLIVGEQLELRILKKIQKRYPQAKKIEGYFKGYDLYVPEIGLRIEVKQDKKSQHTGNYVIEIEYDGKPSALSTTEADYWVHNLVYKDEMILSFIFPVERLRKTMKKMVKNGSAKMISGGDYNKSKLVLLPIKDLISLSMELLSY